MHLELIHDPQECVFFDLETQSLANLKKVGGRKYAADLSTRVLTADFLIDGIHHAWVPNHLWTASPPPINSEMVTPPDVTLPVVVHQTPGLPEPVVEAVRQDRIFVAHNLAEFDYWIWHHLLNPLPVRWFDTLFTARAAGLPGKLDELGKRLAHRGKDDGKKILARLMRQPYQVPKPGYVAAVLRYNVWDVQLGKLVYDLTSDYGEADVIALHQRINERGVGFDVTFGTAIRDLSNQAIEQAAAEITRRTGGSLHAGNLRSVPQVTAWLKQQGVVLPDLRQDTIDHFLDHPEDFGSEDETATISAINPVVFPVLRLRQAALRITRAKLERALATVDDDGRIRGLLSYHNAHTGRFSSSRVQIHNLPRGLAGLEAEALASLHDQGRLTYVAIEQAVAGIKNATVDDALSSLVRLTLVPAADNALLIADFNAIELRGTAWVAGEDRLLDQFAAGRDVYCGMATRIFGRPITRADKTERNVGKVTCLGAVYGMSSQKFGLYCAGQQIDLAKAGTSADACIEAFRSEYPKVAGTPCGVINGKVHRKGGIWDQYNAAAFRAILERSSVAAGRCTFTRNGQDLVVTLPSGRDLTYRNCGIEDRIPAYVYLLGLPEKLKPTLVYDGPKGEACLFGGKITENLVQAICRDLLCCAMLQCEHAGLTVVAHVHDELICEVPREKAEGALRQMLILMSTVPAWAVDFPVVVEGFASPRYTKAPFKGWSKAEAANGSLKP
jgi:DNA polymerase